MEDCDGDLPKLFEDAIGVVESLEKALSGHFVKQFWVVLCDRVTLRAYFCDADAS